MAEQCRGAKLAQIDIEVGEHRSELEHLEFGLCCPVAQRRSRTATGFVIVSGDIKASQIGRQIECGEMVGRKGGDAPSSTAAPITPSATYSVAANSRGKIWAKCWPELPFWLLLQSSYSLASRRLFFRNSYFLTKKSAATLSGSGNTPITLQIASL